VGGKDQAGQGIASLAGHSLAKYIYLFRPNINKKKKKSKSDVSAVSVVQRKSCIRPHQLSRVSPALAPPLGGSVPPLPAIAPTSTEEVEAEVEAAAAAEAEPRWTALVGVWKVFVEVEEDAPPALPPPAAGTTMGTAVKAAVVSSLTLKTTISEREGGVPPFALEARRSSSSFKASRIFVSRPR
jgi:hypothetical protein